MGQSSPRGNMRWCAIDNVVLVSIIIIIIILFFYEGPGEILYKHLVHLLAILHVGEILQGCNVSLDVLARK